MAQHLLRTSVLTTLTITLLLGWGSARADLVNPDPSASIDARLGSSPSQASDEFELRSTIAFTSNRDNPTGAGFPGSTLRQRLLNSAEIYLIDGDGANPRRVTDNTSYDAFPGLSPDGKKIVFDSNRLGDVEPLPTHTCPPTTPCTNVDNFDLFVMNADGSDQQHLTRGASSTWAPNGKYIAYHASKSGTLGLFKPSPSGAPFDSDIFVLNADDCRKAIEVTGVNDCRKVPGEHLKNITNSEDVDDDPDWSPVLPNGTQAIVFTRHPVNENVPDGVLAPHAEIYVMTVNPDGTPVPNNSDKPNPRQLIHTDDREERGPAWSADGTRIAFMRRGVESVRFEIWVMNADGTNQVRLTFNDLHDGTPSWSPDGTRIVFSQGTMTVTLELFSMTMNPDGTCVKTPGGTCVQTQLTDTAGFNFTPNWGELRIPGRPSTATPTPTSTPNAQLNQGAAVTPTLTSTPRATPSPTATRTPTMAPTRTPTPKR